MEYNEEFFEWLDEITYLLPPKMSVHEARLLYDRKIKEEKEEKCNTASTTNPES